MFKKGGVNSKKKILYGTGKLISILECFFAVLFFPYVNALKIPVYIVIIITVLAFTVSIILIPLLYDLINSSPLISTGKYHLVLAVSTVGLALTVILLFTCPLSGGLNGNIIRLFFSMLFASMFFLLYRYVYSSMGSRLFDEKDRNSMIINNIFSALGLIGFIICFLLMYDGSFDAYSEISYIIGIIILLTGFTVYISSYKDMPRFIRLEPPRHRKLGNKYSRFFGSFSNKENIKVFISYFFSSTSLAVFVMSITSTALIFALSNEMLALSLAVFAVSIILFAYIFSRIYKKNANKLIFNERFKLSDIMAISVVILLLFSAAAIIVRYYIDFGKQYSLITFIIIAFVMGIAGGVQISNSKRRQSEVIERSGSTRGNIQNIYNMILLLSVMISITALSIASLFKNSQIINMGILSALAVLSILVNAFVSARLKMDAIKENSEIILNSFENSEINIENIKESESENINSEEIPENNNENNL